MQIENYVYGKNLHLPLLREKPTTMKDDEWTFLDRQALGVIKLTLSRSVIHNVEKEKTTADLMKALFSIYEKAVNKQQGVSNEENIQFEDGRECINSTISK